MTTVKEENTLEELAFELEGGLGGIALKLGTLNDLKSVIEQLRIKMDNIDEVNSRLYFKEFHTSVRLIDDLYHYTMKSLNEEFKETSGKQELMLKKIIREG